MATDIVKRFLDALAKLESDKDVDPLVALYADGSVCGNTTMTSTFDGPDGAREFWSGYRETFSEIRSEFREILADERRAALEWVTTATLAGGDSVRYEGVTVLVFGENDRIARSTAFFDPRPILRGSGA